MSARVYVPTTRAGLAALVADGLLPAAEEAERVTAPAEDEEAEYAALMTAADASTGLAARGGDGSGRRAVVVAELAAEQDPVRLRDVVAVHTDPADRSADADPDDDLAWFAPEELPHLV